MNGFISSMYDKIQSLPVYLLSILRQCFFVLKMEWFDRFHHTIKTHLTISPLITLFVHTFHYCRDINVIVAGIGDRVGMFIQWVSAAIAGMLIGFFSGWKLSLVVCGIVPLITIVGALTAKV